MNQLAMNFDAKRRPQIPYWDTTSLPIHELAAAIRTAEQQDEAVLAIFRALGVALSPSQVWKIGIGNDRHWLLTSVRRSITNLTAADVLVRLAMTRPGPYGRPEHCWGLAVREQAA